MSNKEKVTTEQTEPYQRKMKAKNRRMKVRLIGKGKGLKAAPYNINPSMNRSKSAPPLGEEMQDLIRECIREVCKENGIILTEEEKESLFQKLYKHRKPVALATALGVGVGGLQQRVGAYGMERSAATTAQIQRNIEKMSTRDKAADRMESIADNVQSWGFSPAGDAGDGTLPTNPEYTTEAILPPEWSVYTQAMADKRAGSPQYEIDSQVINVAATYQDVQDAYQLDDRGTSESMDSFFVQFNPETYDFSDASEHGIHGFRSGNPGVPSNMYIKDDGSYGFQNIVYVPYDDIPADYEMPLSGLTKQELYNKYYYGLNFTLEEFEELRPSDEENVEESI